MALSAERRKEYQKKYYKDNKKRLNERRKAQYREKAEELRLQRQKAKEKGEVKHATKPENSNGIGNSEGKENYCSRG